MPPQIRQEQEAEIMVHDQEEEDDFRLSSPDSPSSSTRGPLHNSHDDEDTSFAVSIAALCVGMLTHSYLLISVFPYSGYMAMELIGGVNEETAGTYAGFLASSFMVGRAITSYGWGKVADTYGRTFVLYTSLSLSCLVSILFGLAPTFPLALLARFCLGLSNGIMGTIKTVVSELANGVESKEARGMSIVVGMWGWGFLMAPAISGALAEPIQQYPNVNWAWSRQILERHPFLLCNLLGATLCLVGLTTVALCVRETLPSEKRRSPRHIPSDILHLLKNSIPSRCRRYERLPVLKEHMSDEFTEETPQAVNQSAVPRATLRTIWARSKTRTCLLIYWMYSFVGLTVDETFPLFCISRVAGFGLHEAEIGKILSLCGLLFAVSQYGVYAAVYNRFGLYGAIRTGTSLSAPTMFFMPLSLLLNRGVETGHVNLRTFGFLAFLMATYRVFALVFFSSISVAVNRTVPSQERASMNGLSVLGGSVAKALGPTFAGFLVSNSVQWMGRAGSLLMFSTIGLLGCGVMTLAFIFLRDEIGVEQDDPEDTTDAGSDSASIELVDRIEETK